jgi:ABC-type amino acid transport substrate-binding protein
MPEPNTAIGTAMAPVSMNFGPQNCGAVAQTLLTTGVERRVITDYCDFTTGSAFSGDRSATDARRAGHRKMARLRWAFTPDAQARFASLQAGETDIIWDDNFDNIEKAKKDKSLVVYEYTGSGAAVAAFNTKVPPFDDLRVRQAVVMAIDRVPDRFH